MKWTLLMRFAGPMQSWGTRSRFGFRDTEVAPSKSGVIGLVAAALGRQRGESVADLAMLRLGVREDQAGILKTDYHTALGAIQADGGSNNNAILSNRNYLADAKFLVGLEGREYDQLAKIYEALQNPRWALALGRRSFPPGEPVALSSPEYDLPLVELSLEQALVEYPALVEQENDEEVRYFIETPDGEHTWFDQPLDNFSARTFGPRAVRVITANWGETWS